MSGVYILRIVVTPLEPHYTYHYKYTDNIHFARQTSRGILQLQKEDIYEFMKKRYLEYHVKMVGDLRERGNLVPTVAKHNGSCRAVEKGIPEYGPAHLYP